MGHQKTQETKMIKKLALSTVLFLSFAATAGATTFNISLDGFCNTFALNYGAWSIAGTRAGCGYTVIDGGALTHVTGTFYYLTADTNDGSVLFTWFFTQPHSGKGNWYLYSSDGTNDTLVNSGTYTRHFATENPEANSGKKDVTADIPKRR
jgi:hypothetical protein